MASASVAIFFSNGSASRSRRTLHRQGVTGLSAAGVSLNKQVYASRCVLPNLILAGRLQVKVHAQVSRPVA